MAWINGQWVDEDELQGMLYSGVRPTLPFYDQSSFTSPLSTLNQEATGNFSMWGSPAALHVESTLPQSVAGGSGVTQNYGRFSPQMGMLTDMVSNQPPMIDYSVVTDDPVRPVIDYSMFTENMPTATLPAETELQLLDNAMPNIQAAVNQDTGIVPASNLSVNPQTDQDYLNLGVIPPGTPIGSNVNQSNMFVAPEYRASTPSMIGLGTGWGQKDASGIFGTPTVVGVPTADNQGDVMPDLTGNIDIPAAYDLGLRMAGMKPGLRTSGQNTGQTMYTDEGETDITDLMDKHFEDPNATKNVALAIAQNYQDNPQTQLWNDSIAKSLGLSKHDVEVANSLLGHVDSSDPGTTVTVAPGMGLAPAVTISEESTFQPGVVPTHTIGYGKWLDNQVAKVLSPTKTTTNWVDKPFQSSNKEENERLKAIAKQLAHDEKVAKAKKDKDDKARLARVQKAIAAKQKQIQQQQQAEKTAAQQTARVRNEIRAMLNANRDRGEASEREINAAVQAMGLDFGGLTNKQFAALARNTRGEAGMDETGYTDHEGLGVG